jgi:hypothetical protein
MRMVRFDLEAGPLIAAPALGGELALVRRRGEMARSSGSCYLPGVREGGGTRFAERGILLILCFCTLATLLFVAANHLVPRQEPLSFALVFLVYDLAFYAAFLAPALIALALAGRGLRAPRLPGIGLALVSLSLLALCLVADRKALVAVFHLGGPARFRWLVPLAFSTGAVALASVGWIQRRLLLLPRVLTAATLSAALIALWPTSKAMAPTASSAPAIAASDPSSRFALVGLDGADWRYMEPLIARGELPHIAALRERGAWGPLKTFQPTKSPVIWTTIATGRSPSAHGIRDFTSPHLRGVFDPLPRVRYPAHFGFDHLFTALRWMKLLYAGPVESGARRALAYWELATAAGLPVDVVNWWVTWPAEPVLGHLVSERVYYFRFLVHGVPRETARLTYPEELYSDIEKLVMRPEDVRLEDARAYMDVSEQEFAKMTAAHAPGKTIEGEFNFIHSMHETTRRAALRLIELSRAEHGAPADLLVLFRNIDVACHSALAESELVENHLDVSAERVRKFGRVVSEAYRAADRAIGEIAEAFGPGNVIVVSDHGFQLEERVRARGQMYHHMRSPDGIFIAAGPAFSPGKVSGMTVHDVLPLLAYLKGLPIADDLEGRVPMQAFDAAFARAHPAVSIASYGPRSAPRITVASGAADDAVMEHLRALGYVK